MGLVQAETPGLALNEGANTVEHGAAVCCLQPCSFVSDYGSRLILGDR